MSDLLTRCRCGQTMANTGTGAVICLHCDRACKKPRPCPDCEKFHEATRDHAHRTSP